MTSGALVNECQGSESQVNRQEGLKCYMLLANTTKGKEPALLGGFAFDILLVLSLIWMLKHHPLTPSLTQNPKC